TDFGPGSLTTSGYPRLTKAWKRGTKLADATPVFEGKVEDVEASASYDPTPGFERETAARAMTFYTNESFIKRGGKFVKVDKPDDAEVSFHREWMFVTLRTDWAVGGATYKAGSLLAITEAAFEKGDRKFQVLFEPTPRKSLA